MSMAAALGNFQSPWIPVHHGEVVNQEEEEEEDHDVEEARSGPTVARRDSETPELEDDGNEHPDEVEDEEDDLEAAPAFRPQSLVNNATLRELEEERELARRRTSVCLLLGVFLLFRLWVEALTTEDFGLLMLCLVGTSWCARFIRHNREREEELDRRIQAYMENNGEGGAGAEGRPDFRMLSFQAQLALAIMESQRQMTQGGFGHPDGQAANTGVSAEARSQWERFNFKTVDDEPAAAATADKKGEYGSVGQDDGDELPSCTICLGDYETGEALVKLPCGHMYHDECIASWTAEHSKCPLCNLDLASVATDNPIEID